MKLTVLGSGTSQGIPVIGCGCPVCTSPDSRDKRTRCSLYIQGGGGERVVIDTGPEFRLQALGAGIDRLDAVFLTHAHADHIQGLDDVRPLSREKPIPLYGNGPTIEEFRERFAYIYRNTQEGGGKPRLNGFVLSGPARVGGLTFTPIPVKHGKLDILGYAVTGESAGGGSPGGPARAVYLTDTSHIGEAAFTLIGRPGLLIVGALRVRPHETHFSFDQALEAAARIGADRSFLTHISHEHSHREIEDYCRNFTGTRGIKAEIGPAWDRLELEL
ncbi:MAG: MBL fold metallo-hydrolase [Treponema sp.]|nr:MBL fold metallo-hydrolase [Treponema sp.]